MPPEYDDVVELARELRGRLPTHGPAIVSVDGWTGSGKSTVAKAVADRIGCACVSLDDYLDRHRGGYLEHLDYPKLKADLVIDTCVTNVLL
jgi:uridine kinase